jgi:hypothetical protein
LEQATGIEPAARPWEGRVLPLYDACNIHHFSRYPFKNKDKFRLVKIVVLKESYAKIRRFKIIFMNKHFSHILLKFTVFIVLILFRVLLSSQEPAGEKANYVDINKSQNSISFLLPIILLTKLLGILN